MYNSKPGTVHRNIEDFFKTRYISENKNFESLKYKCSIVCPENAPS